MAHVKIQTNLKKRMRDLPLDSSQRSMVERGIDNMSGEELEDASKSLDRVLDLLPEANAAAKLVLNGRLDKASKIAQKPRKMQKSLNRKNLVSAIVSDTGLSTDNIDRAVRCIFKEITESLKSGDEVRLVGFGTFSVARRAAAKGRNPRTGERIQIEASRTPKFKAGKSLKDAVK